MSYISIIVPCYNQAQYLEEAVNSVLVQTYTNWECIIINDGSLDNTEEIALALTQKDTRIKYFKKTNGGIVSARNFGIEKAQSKWILPLDADDKIGVFYLEYAVKKIKQNKNVGLIYCKAFLFGDEDTYWSLANFDYSRLLFENHIFCSAIFKKEDWFKINGYDYNMTFGFEDWEFWLNLLKQRNFDVIKLDYIGFFYRIKNESRSKTIDQEREKLKSMHRYIYQKHEDIYYQHFGTFQELALKYTTVNHEFNHITKQVNHNFITRILYKTIQFLNKF